MQAAFGLVCLVLAAVVIVAGRIAFKDRPAGSPFADFASMVAAAVNAGLVALGVASMVGFISDASGVWFWIDAGGALAIAVIVFAAAVWIANRIQPSGPVPQG